MPPEKKTPTFDVFSKTREELSRTADSYIALMPGSRRNTPEGIASGGEEWIPDPTRPPRFYVSQGRDAKFWLSIADFKSILTLYEDNKDYIDTALELAGQRAKEKADAMAKLFGE